MDYLSETAPVLTPEQELELIQKYIDSGDSEAIGIVIHARVPWIIRIMKRSSMPFWVDMDSVLSDAMGELCEPLRNYDCNLGAVSTYMAKIVKRSISRSIAEQKPLSDTLSDEEHSTVDVFGSPQDVVDRIRSMFDRIPDSKFNGTSRFILKRILQGHSDSEIARQMGWTVAKTRVRIEAITFHVAYQCKKEGVSAEPWISDDLIDEMAAKHNPGSSLFG